MPFVVRTVLLLLALPLTTSGAAPDLWAFFDLEGHDPHQGAALEFSALRSQVLTLNGHGLRNELKIKEGLRREMYDTSENLSGDVEFHLSPGAKTVFLQYHRNDEHTVVLLLIGDVRHSGLTNGVARDGVFDIYALLRLPDDKVVTVPFEALPNGSSFHFAMVNDHGTVSLTVDGRTVSRRVGSSPAVYLKWGDYLQAQDPFTGKQAPHGDIPGFYAAQGITEDKIVFRNVTYVRN